MSQIVKSSAVFQADLHQLPDQLFISREVDQKIVAHAPGHKGWIMVVDRLHQHLLHGSLVNAAHLPGYLLHFLEKPVKTILHHILGNLLLHGCCGRPCPL